jgi:membrane protein DedA with SNARE-associated domain
VHTPVLQHLLTTYGYGAIIVATFLEGETILLMAGLAAHQGYLSLSWTMAAAWVGSVAGDQLYFWIGREWGQSWLKNRPAWRARLEKVDRLLRRRPALFVLGFRFLYGLRTVSPFAIGMSSTPFYEFLALNALGGALWAAVVAGLGYSFGGAIDALLGRAEHVERFLFAVIAVGGGIAAWVHRARSRPHP